MSSFSSAAVGKTRRRRALAAVAAALALAWAAPVWGADIGYIKWGPVDTLSPSNTFDTAGEVDMTASPFSLSDGDPFKWRASSIKVLVPGGTTPHGAPVLVEVAGGDVLYTVVGGIANAAGGNAGGNEVTVKSDGTVGWSATNTGYGAVFGGVTLDSGKSVSGNTVNIEGRVYNSVFGAVSYADSLAEISGTQIFVTGADALIERVTGDDSSGKVIGATVCRGWTGSVCQASATKLFENTIEIVGGTVYDVVAAEHWVGGNTANIMYDNQVRVGYEDEGTPATSYISNDVTTAHLVGGGGAATTLEGNKIEILNGVQGGDYFGARSDSGSEADLKGNTISFVSTDDTVGVFSVVDFLTASRVEGAGDVTGHNDENINHGYDVYIIGKGVLGDAQVTGEIKGGYAANGSVTGMSVYVQDIIVGTTLLSTPAPADVVLVGGESWGTGADTLEGNRIVIDNATFNGHVFAAWGNGSDDITGNTITIQGDEDARNTFNGEIRAGYVWNTEKAYENQINIEGGTNTFNEAVIVGGNLVINNGDNSFIKEVDTGTSDASTPSTHGNILIYDGTNSFDAAITADNGILIAGGDNTFSAAATLSAGQDLIITDSGNTFESALEAGRDLVNSGSGSVFKDEVDAVRDLIFTGGSAILEANITAGNDIVVTDQATLAIAADLVAQAGTGRFSVGNGSVLNVGSNDFTINSDVFMANGAILTVAKNGTEFGSLVLGTAGDTLTSDGKFLLNIVTDTPSDPFAWDGKTVITLASGDDIDPSIIDSLFYKLAPGSGGTLVVDGGPSFSQALDVIAGNGTLSPTPNIANVIAMMDRYQLDDRNAGLIGALQGSIASIAALSPAEAEIAMRQLIGESMVNVLAAVESNAYKAQGVVFGRLDRIRENLGDNPVPPAAGQGGEANRVWVAGFGVITEAKNRNHVFGYDYDAHGISLGYDRNVYAVPGLRLGASAIFSKGEMDVNDRRTRADLGTTGFGVYASYLLQDGIFLDATAAYGTTEVDYESSQILSGVKSGAFDVDSWQFGLRTGAVLEIGSARFVPSVGVRYTKFKQRGWSEALSPGANSVANDFDGRNDNQVDIPFNLRINRTFDTASFMITPELRLGASFAVKKPDHALSVGFRGSDLRTEIRGVRAKTTTLTAGAGVKITSAGIWDAYVNYDLDAYDGYASHNISGGFGFNF